MSFTSHDEFFAHIPAEQQERIHAKAHALKQAYELSQLRQTANLSQMQLAEKMGVSQANISKIENGQDMHLSTLIKYVNALGGTLSINAHINGKSVTIA